MQILTCVPSCAQRGRCSQVLTTSYLTSGGCERVLCFKEENTFPSTPEVTSRFCLRRRNSRILVRMLERVFASLTLGKEQRLYYIFWRAGTPLHIFPTAPRWGRCPSAPVEVGGQWGHLCGEAPFPERPPLSLPEELVLGSQTREDWTCW